MSASTAPPMPPVSPAEMQVLVARSGLTLNPGQMADLVLAWRQMAVLLTLIPRERPMADDQAFVFRLPPPTGAEAGPAKPPAKPPAKSRPARKAIAAKPARAKPATKPKPARAPSAKKGAARKPARRKR